MNNKIKCPNCGHSFDVEEALSGKLEAQFKAEYEKKVVKQAEKFNQEKRRLEEQKRLFEEQREKEGELFQAEIAKQLKQEKSKIEKNVFESVEEKMKALQEENEKRKSENKLLRQKELDLLIREKELKEKQEENELQVEKQMLEKRDEIAGEIRKQEQEKNVLKFREYEKKLEDQKKLVEEMQRKGEQGSMQLQGEVQELALEDLLSRTYPFDTIEEVPKGIRGADAIQIVINSNQQKCGLIVYESKRTKNFANDWIDKLKQDQIICKADIAVIVTETYPSDMDRFGEKNGVWICSFQEVKSLSFVLREMLIKTNFVKLSQENKGDKMELLYNYLTSNEFVQNIKRIVENYDGMINQLNSEKKAMHKIWAEREKQIWVVQENISALFGSIKGIAGESLQTAGVLQLPDKTIEE